MCFRILTWLIRDASGTAAGHERDSLLRARFIGRRLAGGVVGALVIRYVVGGALLAGLDASALKLLTAGLLLAVLVLPEHMRRLAGGWRRG